MWCLKNNFCLSVQSDEFLICVPREIASDLSLATFPVLSTILQASHILFGCLISRRSSLNLSSVSAHVRTIPYGTSPVLVLLYAFQSYVLLSMLSFCPLSSSFMNTVNGKSPTVKVLEDSDSYLSP